MQHFKDPQLRGGWFFYGPYCIKSLDSSQLQSTLSVATGLLHSLSTVETNSSFVSTSISTYYILRDVCKLIWQNVLHPNLLTHYILHIIIYIYKVCPSKKICIWILYIMVISEMTMDYSTNVFSCFSFMEWLKRDMKHV